MSSEQILIQAWTDGDIITFQYDTMIKFFHLTRTVRFSYEWNNSLLWVGKLPSLGGSSAPN